MTAIGLAHSMPGVVLAYNPNDVKPGWIALFIVLGLCLVTFLLWRSMNRQLRKIKAPPSADAARRRIPGGSGGPSPVESSDAADDNFEGDGQNGGASGVPPREPPG